MFREDQAAVRCANRTFRPLEVGSEQLRRRIGAHDAGNFRYRDFGRRRCLSGDARPKRAPDEDSCGSNNAGAHTRYLLKSRFHNLQAGPDRRQPHLCPPPHRAGVHGGDPGSAPNTSVTRAAPAARTGRPRPRPPATRLSNRFQSGSPLRLMQRRYVRHKRARRALWIARDGARA